MSIERPFAEAEAEADAVSRPSVTNGADADSGGHDGCIDESGSDGGDDDAETGRNRTAAIREIVGQLESEYPVLSGIPLSKVGGHRLRKEVTASIRGNSSGPYRARMVRGVLTAYLEWIAETEDMGIVFSDPDGETVTADMPNSYGEDYLKKKYGIIKDGERAFVRDAPDPHALLLTLTGSNANESGRVRCPGDFLHDLKGSWRDYVRRELQRVMDGLGFERYDPDDTPDRWWEYCVVVEPHKSGYPHMHIGVFTSHAVSETDFAPVMSKHVEKCTMAGSEAHAVSGDAVSVNSVDPESDYDPEGGGDESISNLGSYLAEYIGAGDGEVWDRDLNELITFSLLWATETRRVQFSRGFHKLADEGMDMRTPDDHDAPADQPTGEWELEGIETADGEVHSVHDEQECPDCGEAFSGFPWPECPECMTELKSASTSYMVRIRGRVGGDPPAVRS